MLRPTISLAVLLGLGLVGLAICRPGEPFRDLTLEQAKEAAASEKKVVLIDFFTTWCAPCKRLDAVTWKDASVREWLGGHCVALKLDAEKNKNLVDRFRIDAYPTIILLKPDGTPIGRMVGFKEPKEFLSAANDALAGIDPLSRAREKLVGHERDPMVRQGLADELVEAGQYEEALKEYLWCFDEGKSSSAYTGVRRSFLLGDIARLGERYPPAIKALEDRRDAAEDRFRKGSKNADDVNDAFALNDALDSPEHSLAFYDEIKGSESLPGMVRLTLFREVSELLYKAKRFEDMLGLLDRPAKYIEGEMKMAKLTRDTLKGSSKDEQEAIDSAHSHIRQRVVEGGTRLYEALLATKRADEADKVTGSLIDFEKTGKTFAALIKAAGRQGDCERATALGERGQKELPETEHRTVQRALDEAKQSAAGKPK